MVEENKIVGEIGFLTRKERFQCFRKEVSEIAEQLRTADGQETIEENIDCLETIMQKYVNDGQVNDIRNWIDDVNGTIRAVRMHDHTRSELIKMMEQMLERVDEILADETAKENAEKVRQFFLQCAANAEKIAELVDINKILG